MWGRSGEVYEPVEVDKKDPNFDEDQVITFAFRTVVQRRIHSGLSYTSKQWGFGSSHFVKYSLFLLFCSQVKRAKISRLLITGLKVKF